MRVLQINTIYKNKSTGRTCLELSKALKEEGHACLTAYGHIDVGEEDSYCINSNLEYKIHNVLSRLTGLEGYFSYFPTKRLIKKIKEFNPDIIHLRNLHGHYLNLPMFFKFLKKSQIPVVMHLHDCWILTGKCCHPTYHNNCNGWLTECKNCPARGEYPVSWCFDFSKMMFKHKKKWFAGIENCTVVGVSDWIAGEGKKSYMGHFPVKRVYNWINTDVFKPYEVNKTEYGLAEDKFTVICAGADWNQGNVKTNDLLSLAEKLGDEYQILLMGRVDETINHPRIVKAGFVSDTKTLAQMYSVGDAYVHLSTADTFGKVIAEAMACGTPAVVYNVTACPELVAEGCGAAVELHDVDGIAEELKKIKENGKSAYSAKCVERVKANFSYEKNVQQTIEIYKELLK